MKHPLSIVGAVVFGASWLFLLVGTGADEYRSIISLHKLVIAHAGIVSGLGLIAAGLIAEGVTRLSGGVFRDIAPAPSSAAPVTTERTMSADELSKALADARARLEKK